MLETSRDLLNIIIAFCILWLTFFFSWLLFYLILIAKHAHEIIAGIKEKLDAVERTLALLKGHLDNSAGYLALVVESVGKIASYLVEKKQAKRKTTSSRGRAQKKKQDSEESEA